jgi:hypothetical protein
MRSLEMSESDAEVPHVSIGLISALVIVWHLFNALDIPRMLYLIMALLVNAVFAASFATVYFYAQDRVKMSKGVPDSLYSL